MDWTEVKARKKRDKAEDRGSKQQGREPPAEAEIKQFLATYKTTPCTQRDCYQKARCPFYHDESDRRRNPFVEYYEPTKDVNKFEQMFHPWNYRRVMCRRAAGGCENGAFCAFAHHKSELRDRPDYDDYDAPATVPPGSVLGDAIVAAEAEIQAWDSTMKEADEIISNVERNAILNPGVPPVSIPLTTLHVFCIERHQATFLRRVNELALADLCKVGLDSRGAEGGPCLRLFGHHGTDAATKVVASLDAIVAELCTVRTKAYLPRVLAWIKKRLEEDGRECLRRFLPATAAKLLRFYVDDQEGTLVVLSTKKNDDLTNSPFDVVDMWIKEEKLDRYVECVSCYEEMNPDHVIKCTNAHYFCAAECFSTLVESQLPQLRSQDCRLLCPCCNSPFDDQEIAKCASKSAYKAIQDAVVDAKVAVATEKFKTEFDRNLEAKVQELLEKYAMSTDEAVKDRACRIAADIRNSALHLQCPHCHSPYAEFDGCMALQCASCTDHFCGWCHQGFRTSRGTHQHVRECQMNLTETGSYYASGIQIRDGQRRYRIKALKQYLKTYKKDLRNMIIIELRQDLADLDIDPKALYDVGLV